jgi:hypothetical protein
VLLPFDIPTTIDPADTTVDVDNSESLSRQEKQKTSDKWVDPGFGDSTVDNVLEDGTVIVIGPDVPDDGFGGAIGDPPLAEPFVALVGAQDGVGNYHDEGGEVVLLYGQVGAADNIDFIGESYRIRLVGPEGDNTLHPVAGGCYSAVGGNGDKIIPTAAGEILEFALPALPLGMYTILVCDYATGMLVWQISDYIMIERRKRDRETYRTRNRLHQLYATGPRRLRQEAEYPA